MINNIYMAKEEEESLVGSSSNLHSLSSMEKELSGALHYSARYHLTVGNKLEIHLIPESKQATIDCGSHLFCSTSSGRNKS